VHTRRASPIDAKQAIPPDPPDFLRAKAQEECAARILKGKRRAYPPRAEDQTSTEEIHAHARAIAAISKGLFPFSWLLRLVLGYAELTIAVTAKELGVTRDTVNTWLSESRRGSNKPQVPSKTNFGQLLSLLETKLETQGFELSDSGGLIERTLIVNLRRSAAESGDRKEARLLSDHADIWEDTFFKKNNYSRDSVSLRFLIYTWRLEAEAGFARSEERRVARTAVDYDYLDDFLKLRATHGHLPLYLDILLSGELLLGPERQETEPGQPANEGGIGYAYLPLHFVRSPRWHLEQQAIVIFNDVARLASMTFYEPTEGQEREVLLSAVPRLEIEESIVKLKDVAVLYTLLTSPIEPSQKVANAILAAKRAGRSNRESAKIASIPESMLYEWLLRGAEGEYPHADFTERFDQAETAYARHGTLDDGQQA